MKKQITKELAQKYKELGYPVIEEKVISYFIEVPDDIPRKKAAPVVATAPLLLSNPSGEKRPKGQAGEAYIYVLEYYGKKEGFCPMRKDIENMLNNKMKKDLTPQQVKSVLAYLVREGYLSPVVKPALSAVK